MTIPELLKKIAQTDALPSRWRVQAQKEWILEGATVPEEREELLVEYVARDGEDFRIFGRIETSEPLRYTTDWIEKIVVDRNVPSSVLFPLLEALGSDRRILELEAEAEIPF